MGIWLLQERTTCVQRKPDVIACTMADHVQVAAQLISQEQASVLGLAAGQNTCVRSACSSRMSACHASAAHKGGNCCASAQ